MWRSWLALSVVVTSAAGCTTHGSRPPSADSTAVPVATPVVTAGDIGTTLPTASADLLDSTLTAEPGVSIAVDGGPLPRAVVDAVERRGGELVEPSAWDARFETYGLPHVVGDGVVLIEASIDAARVTNGWQRVDQLQWLFQDTSHDGVGSLLDDAAAAAGIGGLVVVETAELVDGAECTKRAYTGPNAPASPVWTLQGCAFPAFPGMHSLGVARDGLFIGVEAPMVEPTVDQVTATLGGRVDEVRVVFGHPEATGSATTLRISAKVSFDADVDTAAAVVAGGPLVGWQHFPGDASVMFSGTGGASWVLGDGSARFSFDGRLRP